MKCLIRLKMGFKRFARVKRVAYYLNFGSRPKPQARIDILYLT